MKMARKKLRQQMVAATTPGVDLSQEGERGLSGYESWFYNQRTYPADSLPKGALSRAMQHTVANNLPFDPSLSSERTTAGLQRGLAPGPQWRFLGPSTLPDGQTDTGAGPALDPVSGRVQDVAIDPTDPNVVYVGTALGGVWKTTNALDAEPQWKPLTDNEASMAVGSLAIDPVDPDIIYVGTGEASASCGSYYGQGILRSSDGGDTWTLLGGGPTGEFTFQTISKMLIDPSSAGSTNATTVFAAVNLGFSNSGTASCALAPGAITGGVYRSTDSGNTWTLLNLPPALAGTQRIHDMAMDPTNPNVVYVAVRGFGNQPVAGIWKTNNALSSNPSFAKIDIGYIQNAVADPQTRRSNLAICGAGASGTLYSAIESLSGSSLWGFYRTDDGGASWSHVDGGNNGTGNVAAGTNTLTRVSGPAFDAATLVGQRVIFDNSISRTVAAVADADTITLDSAVSVELTAATWSVGSYPTFCNGQCFYNVSLACDPTDATGNTVYVGGNPNSLVNNTSPAGGNRSVWRSTDGGSLWASISEGDGITGGTHTDNHALVMDPSTTPARLYSGNDGGIWRSEDQGASWVTMNTNLAITQFQGVSQHPTNKTILIGGTQDNGTNIRRPDVVATPAWFHTDFGDGGQAYIDQSDPTRMFHTYFNQATLLMGPAKSTNSGIDGPGNWTYTGAYFGFGAQYYNGMLPGDSVSFYAPLTGHPAIAPNLVYFGSNKVYRSPDPQSVLAPGDSWTPVSPVLPAAPGAFLSWIEPVPQLIDGDEVIYTGASDGTISVSADVNDATTGCPAACTSTWATISDPAVTPPRFVTDIETSDADPTGNTLFVTFSGFNASTTATPGHVFMTSNGLDAAPTWVDISGNLPDLPVNAVAVDPTTTPETLYIGTDFGIYRSDDTGATWTFFNNGHPMVAVFGLDRHPSTGQIVSATHGRGMFELIDVLFADGFESGDTSNWSDTLP